MLFPRLLLKVTRHQPESPEPLWHTDYSANQDSSTGVTYPATQHRAVPLRVEG